MEVFHRRTNNAAAQRCRCWARACRTMDAEASRHRMGQDRSADRPRLGAPAFLQPRRLHRRQVPRAAARRPPSSAWSTAGRIGKAVPMWCSTSSGPPERRGPATLPMQTGFRLGWRCSGRTSRNRKRRRPERRSHPERRLFLKCSCWRRGDSPEM